jgi:hypothetical protein
VVDAPTTIAYEGNDQTAGVIERLPDGSFKVSARWREYYNLLVENFGTKTRRGHTTKDLGLSEFADGNYRATREAMSRQYEMRLIRDDEQIDNAGKLINKIR